MSTGTFAETGTATLSSRVRAAVRVPEDRLWFGCTVAAVLLIVVGSFLPLWKMELKAPQYPEGVHLTAYGTRMVGQLQEINTLNHYAGVKAIQPDEVIELKLFPFLMAAVLATLLVLAFRARSRRARILTALVAWAVPLGFLADLQYWLYNYGHDLEENPPLRIGTFTPKVIGTTKVVNFHSETMVSWGFLLWVAAALLISFGPGAIRFLRSSWKNTGASSAPVVAAAVVLFSVAFAILAAQQPRPAAAQGETITARIARAAPGDTITIPSGTYREQLVIDKPLTVEGVGWPVIDGARQGDVVVIAAEGVTLRGFVIQGSNREVSDEPAGIRIKGDRALVEGNRLRDVLYGITVEESDGNIIRGNTISSIEEFTSERRGHAIYLYETSDNVIEYNTTRHSKDGVFVGFTRNTRIDYNNVSDMRYGIHYMSAENNSFTGNVFRHGLAGGALMFSKGITFTHNEFAYNRSHASGYGLLFKDVDDVTMTDNLIHHNRIGLTIEAVPLAPGSFAILRHNLVGFNQTAIELSTTTAVVFSDNTFIGNLEQIATKGGSLEHRNTWSTGGRGNYWDEYQGYDANGDGVGDIPYRYEGAYDELVRRNQALRAYAYTPARTALDLAARWFPVYRPAPKAVDAHPLMSPTMSLSSGQTASDSALSLIVSLALVAPAMLVAWRAAGSLQRRWQPC